LLQGRARRKIVFTENQKKAVRDLEKLSEKDKDEAEKIWGGHSPHAPLGKAMEQIHELRKIRDELRTVHVTLAEIDTHTTRGATINAGNIERMNLDLKTALSEARETARDRTLTRDDRKLAERNAISLQEAATALRKLKENTEKSGDFEVKA
jgi:hypothetical protein